MVATALKNLLVALVLVGTFVAPLRSFARSDSSPPLTFAVVLTRHGVRSPTHTPKTYSWPAWDPVAPGYLTRHGYALAVLIGRFYRSYFAGKGLAISCAPANAYVYADLDQRTLETGRATIEGLCGRPDGLALNHAANTTADDRLFDNLGTESTVDRAALDAVAQRHSADLQTFGTLLGPPPLRDPAAAATYGEDVLLEYLQCRPVAQITPDTASFLTQMQAGTRLHLTVTDLERRSEPVAQERGGNLFAHIVSLLAQHADEKVSGAQNPDLRTDRVAFVVGHDTNIANVAGILDAHWSLGSDFVLDDTPPDGALTFELYRDAMGVDRVRLRFMHETLAQMRSESSRPEESRVEPVSFSGCGGDDCSIPLAQLVRRARELANAGFVRERWTESSDAPIDLAPLADPAWTHCDGSM